jgi:MFS family permease
MAADQQSSQSRKPAVPLRAGELRGKPLRRTLFLVTSGWFFGSVWLNMTSGTPLATYATALGASEFQFGLLTALPFLASLLSLPGALIIEATGKRKTIFLCWLHFQRLMWIPLALVPFWIVQRGGIASAGLAMTAFLVLFFLMHTGQAMGGPGWTGWMADLIPASIRGTYFSHRKQWSLVSAIPAAWGAGWLLDHYTGGAGMMTTLGWCSVLFVVASFFGVADIAHFHWVPDVPTPPKRGRELISSWGEPLHNSSFLWFSGFVGTLIFAVSFMGQFVTLFILLQLGSGQSAGRSGGMNQITQLMLLVVPSIAQLLTYHIWGRAADRMGKRPVMVLAGLGLVPAAIGWCFVTRENIWLGYVLAAAGAVFWSGIEIVNTNVVMEFAGSASERGAKGGTAYVGVNTVITNLAGFLGGISAGLVAQLLRNFHWQAPLVHDFSFFHILFLFSALLRLVAVVVFLPHVVEPTAQPTVDTLRFMTSNIYNNLFNIAMQPLKLVGLTDEPAAITTSPEDVPNEPPG